MHGCCVSGRIGLRSRRCMEEVTVSSKSNRVGAVARQSQVLLPHAHDGLGESPPNGRGDGHARVIEYVDQVRQNALAGTGKSRAKKCRAFPRAFQPCSIRLVF